MPKDSFLTSYYTPAAPGTLHSTPTSRGPSPQGPKEKKAMTAAIEDFASSKSVTRIQVLVGEDPKRIDPPQPLAMSECFFRCSGLPQAAKVIDAINVSDEQLRELHDGLMMWEWNSTWLEERPDGTAIVILGVAWHDEEFYAERKDAWLGRLHRKIFEEIGISLDDVTVQHWLRDSAA